MGLLTVECSSKILFKVNNKFKLQETSNLIIRLRKMLRRILSRNLFQLASVKKFKNKKMKIEIFLKLLMEMGKIWFWFQNQILRLLNRNQQKLNKINKKTIRFRLIKYNFCQIRNLLHLVSTAHMSKWFLGVSIWTKNSKHQPAYIVWNCLCRRWNFENTIEYGKWGGKLTKC